jgi:hypothetical protein
MVSMTTTLDSYHLAAFVEERYDIDDNDELRCKRCGQVVDWVTRHAAEKHGDDVEVIPVRNENASARW